MRSRSGNACYFGQSLFVGDGANPESSQITRLAGLDRHLGFVIMGSMEASWLLSIGTFSVDVVMRNCLIDNKLRFSCSREGRHRGAFTLAELVVSIGILVLMFSLAGQVFSVTVKSTGQANAVTDVSQVLRVFERTLRDDLRHVQPGQSLVVIQGNPVNAYWTRPGLEADDDGDPSTGYPHPRDPQREHRDRVSGAMVMDKPRADLLMFFTARKGQSFVTPEVTSNLQQVVYGHAELGEYEFVPGTGNTPGTYQFVPPVIPSFPSNPSKSDYPSPTTVSTVPSSDWHLARRSVVLLPSPSPLDSGGDPIWVDATAGVKNDAYGLADEGIIRGTEDIVAGFDFDDLVLRPGAGSGFPYYLPAILAGSLSGTPSYLPDAVPFRRSQLDPTPPPQMFAGLGHYFVPNCASFKVEWALDPGGEFVDGRLDGQREVYWFDPGAEPDLSSTPRVHSLASLEAVAGNAQDDPNGKLNDLLRAPSFHPEGERYSLANRFVGPGFDKNNDAAWVPLAPDGRPNLVVFGNDRLAPAMSLGGSPVRVPDDVFPSALRITIDVYDNGQRLAKPIRHVMVVPLGG